MSTATSSPAPIALQTGEGESIWFAGGVATIKSSAETTQGRVAVFDVLLPKGPASPMHIHHREDEWFYVLEGTLRFWVGGQTIEAPPGSFVYGPRGIPHTFEVASEQAHYLLVDEPAGFERFLRAAGEPAQSAGLPPATAEPPDPERLTAIAAEYGIEITGPPGLPD